ncbi:hypothetical protein DQ04_08021030 [Trypanosoma grayi]|uniref:hypothetical protein n=1 Tax=Trypanosoma grayi TaxID=71804 RepID=UPI0004F488DA|nr:hypothetical protein DQ04_08021030 [Trypanosoma grayi]KEG08094.1 hypothetical protein DQ04_08021030 [Trypanosoma grayi]
MPSFKKCCRVVCGCCDALARMRCFGRVLGGGWWVRGLFGRSSLTASRTTLGNSESRSTAFYSENREDTAATNFRRKRAPGSLCAGGFVASQRKVCTLYGVWDPHGVQLSTSTRECGSMYYSPRGMDSIFSQHASRTVFVTFFILGFSSSAKA